MDEGFRLWGTRRDPLPPRPDDPSSFPESDARHWYDLEYAGRFGGRDPGPESPGDGPAGKRIVCLRPGPHPYMTLYDAGMTAEANRHGMDLSIRCIDWSEAAETRTIREVVGERPDLAIVVPEDMQESGEIFARFHAARIPVIASNLKPGPGSFRYLLAWTGPDDWGQFRSLAAEFVARTSGSGGYCLVTHRPGSSAYYARLWATVTEIRRLAPGMRLLDARFTGFRADLTQEVVEGWIRTYGDELSGIVSADDSAPMLGVGRAIESTGRRGLVLVACGTTGPGLRLLKEGRLDAITFQSPELDGALPVRVAADWFNSLEPEPVRYLPYYIITRENVDDFLLMPRELSGVDAEGLCIAVSSCDSIGVRRFFGELRDRFRAHRIIPEEYFFGSCMELLARLHQTARLENVVQDTVGRGVEVLFKHLTMDRNPGATLDWLERRALSIVDGIGALRGCRGAPGERLLRRVEADYASPLSLKGLASGFGISAARLGSLFRETTGESFSRYLNSYRIGKACRLLETGRLSAKEVAVRVGFSDPNYFYAVFRRLTGMNPSAYSGPFVRGAHPGPDSRDGPDGSGL